MVRSGLTLLSVWGVKTEGGSDEQSRSSSSLVRARVQTTRFLVYSRHRRRLTTTTIIIKYTIIIIPFKATGRPPPRAYALHAHQRPHRPVSFIINRCHFQPFYKIHGHNRGLNPQLCLPREIFVILFFSANRTFLSITFFKFNKNNNTITTIIKTVSIVQAANTHRRTI